MTAHSHLPAGHLECSYLRISKVTQGVWMQGIRPSAYGTLSPTPKADHPRTLGHQVQWHCTVWLYI